MHGAWIDVYDSRNKDKNITIMKNKSVIFSMQCILVIPHPVIAAIWDVILNILQRWKTKTCQSNFKIQPKTIRKYLLTANLISGWILL